MEREAFKELTELPNLIGFLQELNCTDGASSIQQIVLGVEQWREARHTSGSLASLSRWLLKRSCHGFRLAEDLSPLGTGCNGLQNPNGSRVQFSYVGCWCSMALLSLAGLLEI